MTFGGPWSRNHTETGGRVRPTGPRDRLAVLLLTLGFALLSVAFALATPPFGGPDEPNHTARAWGVHHGSVIIGAQYDATGQQVKQYLPTPPWVTVAEQPATPFPVPCFAGDTTVTAGMCPPTQWNPGPPEPLANSFTSYFPTYYALVGWPFAVSDGAGAYYAARAMAVLLSVGAVGAGLWALVPGRGTRANLALLSVPAITPTAVALFGVLSPNGFEIALAFLVTCLLWRARAPGAGHAGAAPSIRARVGFVAACLLLVTVRPSGAVWLAGILGAFVLLTGLRDRRSWLNFHTVAGAAVVLLGVALAAINPPYQPSATVTPWLTPMTAVWYSVTRTADRLHQAIGISGWLDTPIPITLALVGLTTWVILVYRAWTTSRQARLAICWLLGFALVLPWLLEAVQASRWLGWWQGRYQLPAVVALIVVCVLLLRTGRLATWITVGIWGALHWVLLVATVARNTTGFDGATLLTRGAPQTWWPPAPSGVIIALGGVAVGLWLTATWLSGGWSEPISRSRPSSAAAPAAPVPSPATVTTPPQSRATPGASSTGQAGS